jgi:hypothetical protein
MGLIFYFPVDEQIVMRRYQSQTFLGQLSGLYVVTFCPFHILTPLRYFQALTNPAIAAGKKCCWCCAKLSELMNPTILIPGSHGTIYPWCPPRIGVSLGILEALESELWIN